MRRSFLAALAAAFLVSACGGSSAALKQKFMGGFAKLTGALENVEIRPPLDGWPENDH